MKEINEQINAITWTPMLVKDSKGNVEELYCSDRSLVLMDERKKNLYLLIPEKSYIYDRILAGTFVIADMVYSIEKVIHISDEEAFLKALQYKPEVRPSFRIELDGKETYSTNRSVIAWRKVRDMVKAIHAAKLCPNSDPELSDAKQLIYYEPENKVTTWLWN